MATRIKKPDPRTDSCPYCRHEVNHAALGHSLRAEREKVGLSQKEVAGAMDIKPPYLCAMERGRQPWTAVLVRKFLAAVRGTTV